MCLVVEIERKIEDSTPSMLHWRNVNRNVTDVAIAQCGTRKPTACDKEKSYPPRYERGVNFIKFTCDLMPTFNTPYTSRQKSAPRYFTSCKTHVQVTRGLRRRPEGNAKQFVKNRPKAAKIGGAQIAALYPEWPGAGRPGRY